jgi:hypothetical protein
MKVVVSDAGIVTGLELVYPNAYSFDEKWEIGSDHEKIAAWLADNREQISTYMIIIESERLADEHLDDPDYLHQTNHICVSRAEADAIDALTNKWFREKEFNHFIDKYKWPTLRYNYQKEPEGEKRLMTEIEDALFRYQQNKKMFQNITDLLSYAKYKLDEDGYPLEDETNEDGEYLPAANDEEIENNKEKLLERFLLPQVRPTYDRVYAMPEPLHHWDHRSFWHQFFFIENHKTQQVMWSRGQGGGSASREANGRWAHTFAQLEKLHGIKTPSWHMVYDSHNVLRCHTSYDSFKSFRYDLTGNYHWDWKDSEKLFDGMLIQPVRKENLWLT